MNVVFSLHGLDYDFFMGGAECAFVGVKTACLTSANTSKFSALVGPRPPCTADSILITTET